MVIQQNYNDGIWVSHDGLLFDYAVNETGQIIGLKSAKNDNSSEGIWFSAVNTTCTKILC